MVSALHKAGDSLVIPNDLGIKRVSIEEFENLLAKAAG